MAEDKDLFGGRVEESSEQESKELLEQLEGELVEHNYPSKQEREVRLINRSFSLAEYSNSFTKMQWLLFIEIYDLVKEFYLDQSERYIESFTMENITIRVPINRLDKNLFDASNRSKQLKEAAEGLMDMRVRNYLNSNEEKQMGFDFISMFPRITYNPRVDRDHMIVRIQSEIYEEMVPIESYAQLDLRLLEELDTGNAQRLYSIFKSYSFKPKFTISFTDLRKKMGFFETGKYPEWKYFNDQVLKKAVNSINKHDKYDISLKYRKARGKEEIIFEVTNYGQQKKRHAEVLDLNEPIDPKTRVPNRIQRKFIRSTIKNCQARVDIPDSEETISWIISDVINSQRKQGFKFDFKHALNAISKQIQTKIYTMPYAHNHLLQEAETIDSVDKILFDEYTYQEISRLDRKGLFEELRAKFTNEELKAHRYGYLIDQLGDFS